MTQIARLYGSSMYDLAAEEQLTDTVLEFIKNLNFTTLACETQIITINVNNWIYFLVINFVC